MRRIRRDPRLALVAEGEAGHIYCGVSGDYPDKHQKARSILCLITVGPVQDIR